MDCLHIPLTPEEFQTINKIGVIHQLLKNHSHEPKVKNVVILLVSILRLKLYPGHVVSCATVSAIRDHRSSALGCITEANACTRHGKCVINMRTGGPYAPHFLKLNLQTVLSFQVISLLTQILFPPYLLMLSAYDNSQSSDIFRPIQAII